MKNDTEYGSSAKPPPINPARGPSDRDDAFEPLRDWNFFAQRELELEPELDQGVAW